MTKKQKLEVLHGMRIVLLMRKKKSNNFDTLELYGYATLYCDMIDNGWFPSGLKYVYSLWLEISSSLKPVNATEFKSESFDETLQGIQKVINQIKNTTYESLH